MNREDVPSFFFYIQDVVIKFDQGYTRYSQEPEKKKDNKLLTIRLKMSLDRFIIIIIHSEHID